MPVDQNSDKRQVVTLTLHQLEDLKSKAKKCDVTLFGHCTVIRLDSENESVSIRYYKDPNVIAVIEIALKANKYTSIEARIGNKSEVIPWLESLFKNEIQDTALKTEININDALMLFGKDKTMREIEGLKEFVDIFSEIRKSDQWIEVRKIIAEELVMALSKVDK